MRTLEGLFLLHVSLARLVANSMIYDHFSSRLFMMEPVILKSLAC